MITMCVRDLNDTKLLLGIDKDSERKALDMAIEGNYTMLNQQEEKLIRELVRLEELFPDEYEDSVIIRFIQDVFGKTHRIEWGHKCKICESCSGSGECEHDDSICGFCEECSGEGHHIEDDGALVITNLIGEIVEVFE